MSAFLALVLGERYWRLHSLLMCAVLRLRGLQVGRGVTIQGVPRLKIRGRAGNIVIEDGVSILGDIDLRNREDGRIVIREGAAIEGGCRLVAARQGLVEIGAGTSIGAGAIFNAGSDIRVGRRCTFAARVNINSSEHLHARSAPIRDQGFEHAPVVLGEDCWIGVNVTITMGVTLGQGSVVGANAVVTHDTDPYSINVGVPARKIGERG